MFGDISIEEYTSIYNQAYNASIPGKRKAGIVGRSYYFEKLMAEHRAKCAESALQALRKRGA